jgi:glyoxylase-like metal-dependent hydrolase (beta-lactamase superfamily II)
VRAAVRVHHLNCGTLCPYGARLFAGEGGLGPAKIVCHCLLVEAGDSLVLIDTGLGVDDMRHPYRRLGVPFVFGFNVKPNPAETAVEQIRRLGLDPADVRHIACTHLDLDHAGGLPDFPEAEVHVFEPEREAAVDPSLRDRLRYPPCHLEHGPRWATHTVDGDEWFGFEAVRVLPGVDPEILLIPLVGHSRGHSGIAVREGERWLLHCGDAYFHHAEMAEPPSCPPGLRAFQTVMAADGAARRSNQERLRELARGHGDEVTLFCAHSHVELERSQVSEAAAEAAV